jgi:hypothetical protein
MRTVNGRVNALADNAAHVYMPVKIELIVWCRTLVMSLYTHAHTRVSHQREREIFSHCLLLFTV